MALLDAEINPKMCRLISYVLDIVYSVSIVCELKFLFFSSICQYFSPKIDCILLYELISVNYLVNVEHQTTSVDYDIFAFVVNSAKGSAYVVIVVLCIFLRN